jgi:ribosomal protein S18 acetylase RimI-like enzyme
MRASIRPYRDEDRDGLAGAMAAVWDGEGPFDGVSQDESYPYIDRALERDATVLVAEDDGEIIGFTWAFDAMQRPEPYPSGFFDRLDSPVAFFDELGVVPSRRHHHLGGFLVEALLERLESKYATVILRTHPDAEEALRLYRDIGFRWTGYRDIERPERYLMAMRL